MKDAMVDASIDGRPVLFDRFPRFHRYLTKTGFFLRLVYSRLPVNCDLQFLSGPLILVLDLVNSIL